MNSAAASRFAARYGLTELPHTPMPDGECPTCPTPSEGVGAPPAAPEVANFNDFSGDCPTSPTCPTRFEGVESGNSTAGGQTGYLTDWLQEGGPTPKSPENGGEPPVMSPEEWASLAGEPVVDSWGLTAEQRAEGLSRLKAGVGHPATVGQEPGVGQQAPAEDMAPSAIEDAGWHARVERNGPEPFTAGIAQTIPHETMMAGLLAASRMRPKPVIEPTPMTKHPWAAGIAKLQIMYPLDGFSMSQWKWVQHGCTSLLASHGAEMTRLGWTVEDAFGAHPGVPGSAIHAYGLGLLLGDGKVVEMTESGARIETRRGVGQSFTRRSNAWSVPIWTVGA